MSKVRPLTVLVAVAAVTAASAAAFKTETELAVFGPYGTTEDLSSMGTSVIVGTNVWTYSPDLIELYLSDSLVAETEIPPGWHPGRARCLKKNGPEGSRLDFYFACTGEDLGTCPYRLIVRFGIYERKQDVAVFDLAEALIFATGPDPSQLKAGTASFTIAFQAEERK